MNLNLKDKKWKEFLFNEKNGIHVINSKAYHKSNLKEILQNSISYVTRTNINNGVESIVEKLEYQINDANTISFGAENATFFYQPNEYITGNKMYYIKHHKLNKYSGLFIQLSLNKSIENCSFGYGKGLTGTRMKKRFLLLPANSKGEPDFEFMENYMKQKEQEKFEKYKIYIKKRIKKLQNYTVVKALAEKEWKEFFLKDVFSEIKRGKRLIKANQKRGKTPYVSSKASNNGIDGYICNKEKVRFFSSCLTVANSGSVGACFYHPYQIIASDHVTHLKNDSFNSYVYTFISILIFRLGIKYSFNREMSDERIKREKILLPINKKNEPDYDYMENYMKQLEYKKLKQYLDYQSKNNE